MRRIKNIIKLELKEFIYSPVIWLILILLTIGEIYIFIENIEAIISDQEIFSGTRRVTFQFFCADESLTAFLRDKMFWFVPLLSMNIFSKEKSSGTWKLLLSSPIKLREIVIGKYIALLIVGFLLLISTSLFIIPLSVYIDNFDWGLCFSSFLGVALLYCIYAALGALMSSLTSKPIVAGISTFGLLFFFNSIGELGNYFPRIYDICNWLSLKGRTSDFFSGLVSFDALFYFFSVTIFISLLTYLNLKREISSEKNVVTIARPLFALFFLILLGQLSTKYLGIFSIDLTHDNRNSLSKESKDILNNIEGELKITTFVNMADYHNWKGTPSNIYEDKNQFKKYRKEHNNISFEYVYYLAEGLRNPDYDSPDRVPYSEMARLFCEANYMDFDKLLSISEVEAEYGATLDFKGEKNSCFRLLEDESGNSVKLRLYDDMSMDPKEREISTALKGLYEPNIRVGYFVGYGGRSLESNKETSLFALFKNRFLRYSLVNQGFTIEEININKISDKEINVDNYDILVVPDNSIAYPEEIENTIISFLKRGKKLLIFSSIENKDVHNGLFSELGLKYLEGDLLYVQDATNMHNIFCTTTEFMPRRGIPLVIPYASALDYDINSSYEITPLIQTPIENTVLLKNSEVVKDRYLYNTALLFDDNAIVVSSPEIFTKKTLNTNFEGIYSLNEQILADFLYVLTDGKAPITISRDVPKDIILNMNFPQLKRLKPFIIFPLPILFLLLSLVVIIPRTRT